MSNLPVDRDPNYMREMWGTSKLITDYNYPQQKRVIQEVMNDTAPRHDLKKQTELHEKIRNENAIVRSVRNLVETIPRERFFNLSLGSNIRSSLFDFVDFGTAANIRTQIETVISNYEPRIDNLRVEVVPQPDENTFDVTIIFDIVGQSIPSQSINFILEATR